jgi:hypothetical protein
VTDTAAETWYQREPKRLTWEFDQFERHGLPVEVTYDSDGRLVAATEVRFRSEPLAVRATYPHQYPYFPPTIDSDRYVLDRHQHPLRKNFCLLEDELKDLMPWFSAAQLIG